MIRQRVTRCVQHEEGGKAGTRIVGQNAVALLPCRGGIREYHGGIAQHLALGERFFILLHLLRAILHIRIDLRENIHIFYGNHVLIALCHLGRGVVNEGTRIVAHHVLL